MIWIWIWMIASPLSCPAHSRLKTSHKAANQTTRYISKDLKKTADCYRDNSDMTCILCLQFQFKEIVLTDEERRLLAKEGATIPAQMPLTKVREVLSDLWWFHIEAMQEMLKCNMMVLVKLSCLFRQRNGPWRGWGERSGISSLLRRVARRRKFMLMA